MEQRKQRGIGAIQSKDVANERRSLSVLVLAPEQEAKKSKVEMIMSSNLNLATAPGAVGHDASVSVGQRVKGLAGRWLASWREMMALRRSLQEISQLSERELLDIGLRHDEIVRLRSSEYFMPRSWQVRPVGRGELPF